MRAVYEIRPPAWGETLAILQSVSLPGGPERVRARVVDVDGELVTVDFPALDGETSAEQLLAACVAGEWADRGDVESCRLVAVDWPEELPGPAFPAAPGVSVGAIVKPALGLTPEEAAAVAAELAAGGAQILAWDDNHAVRAHRAHHLGATEAIVVIHHTDCGMLTFDNKHIHGVIQKGSQRRRCLAYRLPAL